MSKSLLLLIAILITTPVLAQNALCLDGFTNDWHANATIKTDPTGDGNSIDLLKLSIFNDSINLYLRLEMIQEINLQENNDLTLYIDIDNNSSTGSAVNGVGADLIYVFGDRKGTFKGSSINHYDLGLITLPTHSSNIFEMALARGKFPNNADPIFPQDSIKIVIKDNTGGGDVLPNSGAIFYTFKNGISTTLPAIPLERDDTSFLRVMNYNILFDGPLEPARQAYFTKILNVINPDVILFNEFFSSSSAAVKTYLDNVLPLNNGDGWYTVKLDQGNITASRFPIKQNWVIYAGYRLTGSLIDLNAKFGKDMLFINAHLRCCSNNTERQLEANALAAFFEDIKNPGGMITLPDKMPFLLAGDLNLVGDYQQLKTILEGDITDTITFGTAGKPDWDGMNLTDLAPHHSESCVTYTWRDETSSFAPGRLDFMIYTASVLEVAKSYILDAERMSNDQLLKYQLNQVDSRGSDHLPLVADFRLKNETGMQFDFKKDQNITVYPNPVFAGATLKIESNRNSIQSLEIFDLQGKLLKKIWIDGDPTSIIDLNELHHGIYFLRVSGDDYSEVKKIIKL